MIASVPYWEKYQFDRKEHPYTIRIQHPYSPSVHPFTLWGTNTQRQFRSNTRYPYISLNKILNQHSSPVMDIGRYCYGNSHPTPYVYRLNTPWNVMISHSFLYYKLQWNSFLSISQRQLFTTGVERDICDEARCPVPTHNTKTLIWGYVYSDCNKTEITLIHQGIHGYSRVSVCRKSTI